MERGNHEIGGSMTSTTGLSVEEAGRVFVDPSAYAEEDRFHAATALLRRESPVHWVDEPGYRPFWAITRHADVMDVERDNARFLSAPRPLLATEAAEALAEEKGQVLRTLIHMDEPDHKAYRAIAAAWFQPNALKRMEDRMRELAVRFVDRMAELGTECDFVRDIAVHYPLYVILSLLGLKPRDRFRIGCSCSPNNSSEATTRNCGARPTWKSSSPCCSTSSSTTSPS